MSRIQVLIDDEPNRNAVAKLLAQRYDVEAGGPLQDADLYVVDDRSLPERRTELLERKHEAQPTFCPVVLIQREDTRINVELPDHDEYEEQPLIDEVVTAPVGKNVLFRRVSNLLVRREQFLELREKTERLEEFASLLSHDLRNPLTVATGHLELLDEIVGEEGQKHVAAIERGLVRMENLINDLLTVARQGRAVDDVEPVALEAVAREAWEHVASDETSLVVEEGGATELLADEEQLLQVFENLFRNAVDHGDPDGTVRVGALSSGFYVADDGPGISPDQRGEVFEQGFTTDGSGTGLGLSIVTDVVEAHGWEISVTESAGGGAQFEIVGVETAE